MSLKQNLSNLCTRRSLGFCLASLLIYLRPEQSAYITALYGLLIGVAVIDSFKVRGELNNDGTARKDQVSSNREENASDAADGK